MFDVGNHHFPALARTALAEDAQVTAHANDSLLTVAAVAGSGEGFALAGTFSLTTLDRVAVASVDDEATVRAKELTVQGKQEAVSWSVGGGLSVGQGASVGLGVGVHEGTLSATGSIADPSRSVRSKPCEASSSGSGERLLRRRRMAET